MEQEETLDTTNEYFKHLGKLTQTIDREQNAKLWALAKKGDKKAKHQILENNLRLVIPTAKRFLRPGVELMDLVEEGNLGLLQAIEKYEPKKGYRFSTYAIYWIEQYIRRYVEEQAGSIKIPAHAWNNLKRWFRSWNELKEANGREPTLQEMAKELDLSARQVYSILDTINAAKGIDSLAMAVGEEEEMTLEEILSDDGKGNPHEVFSSKEDHNTIKQSLSDLDDRDREIIVLRYGLDNKDPMTLGEVAREMGLSRERVRQLEERAILTLRREALRSGVIEDSAPQDHRTLQLHTAMRPRAKTNILGEERHEGALAKLLRAAAKAQESKPVAASRTKKKASKKTAKKVTPKPAKKTAKKVAKKAVKKAAKKAARPTAKKAVRRTSRK